MPRETFLQQLDQLHVKLVTMGSQVDTALEETIQAFETQNTKQAEEVIKNLLSFGFGIQIVPQVGAFIPMAAENRAEELVVLIDL